jgi:excisionase family DNA binding protein
MDDEMMDYVTAAAFLGVKVATLYSMVSRGQVPHTRIGRRLVRFPRTALAKWITTCTFVPGETRGAK